MCKQRKTAGKTAKKSNASKCRHEYTKRADGVADCKDPDMRIMTIAAARYMGQSVADFEAEAILSAIEATIDAALGDGLPGLPLTRRERAAMSTTQASFHCGLAMTEREKKSA